MSADAAATFRYIEYEAGQLIRQARAERDKALREANLAREDARRKDDEIRELTSKVHAERMKALRAQERASIMGNARLKAATREAAEWDRRNPCQKTVNKRRAMQAKAAADAAT